MIQHNDDTPDVALERAMNDLQFTLSRRLDSISDAMKLLQLDIERKGWRTSSALSEAQGAYDATFWCWTVVTERLEQLRSRVADASRNRP